MLASYINLKLQNINQYLIGGNRPQKVKFLLCRIFYAFLIYDSFPLAQTLSRLIRKFIIRSQGKI